MIYVLKSNPQLWITCLKHNFNFIRATISISKRFKQALEDKDVCQLKPTTRFKMILTFSFASKRPDHQEKLVLNKITPSNHKMSQSYKLADHCNNGIVAAGLLIYFCPDEDFLEVTSQKKWW